VARISDPRLEQALYQLKPWLETASFSDFIPIALELLPDAQGYLRLPTKFYEKHIKPVSSYAV
jgi:hypothetical protein